MADSDLPVFSFRPNWKEGVIERLAFFTNVLSAAQGAEQRRRLRLTPRRTIEADFLLYGPERAFFDLFVNAISGQEVMVPLYWDLVKLSAPLVATASDRINFDNTRREFAVGLAILSGPDALSYEVVEISAMDDTGIDLAAPVSSNWPAGTVLMPLRRAVFDEVGSLPHVTAGVANVTVRFLLTVPNPWTPLEDDAPVYAGYPVFLEEPNWVDPLPVDYDRLLADMDNQTGVLHRVDVSGRAKVGQAHRWFLHKKESLARFRDLVYRYEGRAGAFWLPTFKQDLELVNSPGSAATQIEVKKIGYGYTGGPVSGREYIAIKHDGGTILRKVTSVIAGLSSQTERINLDAPLGLALSPGQVRRISFADIARFDQDIFDLTHYTGLDGLTECQAVFRTFKNVRTAPLPIHLPIITEAMGISACGIDTESDECYAIAFDGWYAKAIISLVNPTVSLSDSNGFYVNPDGPAVVIDKSDNTPWGATNSEFPEGIPKRIYSDGGNTVTLYWCTENVMDSEEVDLRLQFPAASVGSSMRATFSWQFWNAGGASSLSPITSTIISPGTPSHTSGSPFDVRSLWPDNWFFAI